VIPGRALVISLMPALLLALLAVSPPARSDATPAAPRRMIGVVRIKEVLHTPEHALPPGQPEAYFPDNGAGKILYFRAGDAPGEDTALVVSRQLVQAGPAASGSLSVEGFRFGGAPGEVPLSFARKAILALDPSTGDVTLSIEGRDLILKPGAGTVHIKDDRFDPMVKVDGHDVTRYGLFARNDGLFPAGAFTLTAVGQGASAP
jgi:hypothetical protein